MAEHAAMILTNVKKNFGETRALSPLSLHIEKGERIALIGPSGAGKTTLLNMLANSVFPDEGKVIIDDRATTQYTNKQFAKKVGMLRQQFDLVGALPVIHNVLVGRLSEWGFFKSLLSYLIPQEKELAIRALKKVGLLEKLYEKTSTLSGGEQQRVALARLLVQNPEIILADEPVASLDPARADDVLSMLMTLASEANQTVITSLHSVELAKKHFNRLIALRKGKVFFDLPTEKVSNQHLTDLYELVEL